MEDRKLLKWLGLLLLLPLGLAWCSEERFRYPCQNPDNWEESMCQKPICEVTRTCPELIFKSKVPNGTNNENNKTNDIQAITAQGNHCGK